MLSESRGLLTSFEYLIMFTNRVQKINESKNNQCFFWGGTHSINKGYLKNALYLLHLALFPSFHLTAKEQTAMLMTEILYSPFRQRIHSYTK